MRVHAIQTGTVEVHERQRAGSGRGLRRALNTLLDPNWSGPLPIHCWVVEHPEGLLVIDTGETARAVRPGYYPRWHPYYRRAVRVRVEPSDEVGPRMRALGLHPDDVRWVVLTHLHTDHTGGLHHFPSAEILVAAAEHAVATGPGGRLRGYLPHRWPDWFRPTLLDEWETGEPGFGRSHPLTRAGDVRLVPTPGHTAGHLSVLLDEGPHTLLFAGDASYSEANLMAGIVDGLVSVGAGATVAAATLRAIRDFMAARPTVFLPSHDPDAARRLLERRVRPVRA